MLKAASSSSAVVTEKTWPRVRKSSSLTPASSGGAASTLWPSLSMKRLISSRALGIDTFGDIRAREMHVFFGRDLDPARCLAFYRFLYFRRDARRECAIGN